jgi:hypothetical protein
MRVDVLLRKYNNVKVLDENENVLVSDLSCGIYLKDIIYVNGGNENLGFTNLVSDLIGTFSSGEIESNIEFKPFLIHSGFDFFDNFRADNILLNIIKLSPHPVKSKEILNMRASLGLENKIIKKFNLEEKILFHILLGFAGGFRIFVLEDVFMENSRTNARLLELIQKFSEFSTFIIRTYQDRIPDLVNKVIFFNNENRFIQSVELSKTTLVELTLSKSINLKKYYIKDSKALVSVDKVNELKAFLDKSGVKVLNQIEKTPTAEELIYCSK